MATQALDAASPEPIALPQHVRRFCQRTPDGSTVQVLRDNVVVATFASEGRHLLNNVRSIVSADVAKRGPAVYVLAVDDSEVRWDTASDDPTSQASESDARAFARSMEQFGFRALDKAMESAGELARAARASQKAAAKNAALHAKALKILARALRKEGRRDPEVERAEIEAAQEVERLDLVKQLLPSIFSREPGGASKLAAAVLGFLDDAERKSVLATAEGRMLSSAKDDETAAVALRALWSLVADGTVTLRPETITAAMQAFGGAK